MRYFAAKLLRRLGRSRLLDALIHRATRLRDWWFRWTCVASEAICPDYWRRGRR